MLHGIHRTGLCTNSREGVKDMGPRERYAEVVSAEDLKVARLDCGLSLRDAARLIDRPAAFTFIGRLERGVTKTLSPELAYALLNVYGIQPTRMHHYFKFHGIAGASFRRVAA
jgi:transcriptional regulator with XRE-family HTH domain